MASIVDRYVQMHPKSAKLYEKAKGMIPDGVSHEHTRADPFPLYITDGQDCRKWDVDGNEYIDFRCGNGALIFGHAYPEIVEAVTSQMAKGTHYVQCHEVELKWAHWIKSLVPSVDKVSFHNSGSEATLMAMRLARAYTRKSKILKFKGHYHGWQDYGIVGAEQSLAGIPQGVQDAVIVLPPGDISIVEKTLQEDRDIAAVILEPTGGHLGNRALKPGFLQELREVTKRYGVLLIFDEVVTGFRASPGGAQVRYDVYSDVTAMGKILGGGLPSGAVGGRADVMDMSRISDDPEWNATRRVPRMGNYNGNPLSAAAGSTALELIGTKPINVRADAMAKCLKDGLNDLFIRMEVPGCATGVASLVHHRIGLPHDCDKEVCMLSDEEMSRAQNPRVLRPWNLAMKNHGIDVGPTTFFVSTVHTEKAVDATVEAYEKALRDLRKEGVI